MEAVGGVTSALRLVAMGEVQAGRGDYSEFSCMGIGSGVVLLAYDEAAEVGACAHFFLPQAPKDYDRLRPGKYVDTGVAEALRQMSSLEADGNRIRMALVGGASLISGDRENPSPLDLGYRNLEAAIEILNKHGFVCLAQDVGGQIGRAVSMDQRGFVKVRTCMQPERVLCNLKG